MNTGPAKEGMGETEKLLFRVDWQGIVHSAGLVNSAFVQPSAKRNDTV